MTRKIQMLKGPTTPQVFAGILLEHASEIEHIACVIRWKDDPHGGLTGTYATQMRLADAAWLKHVFNVNFMHDHEGTTGEDRPEPESLDPKQLR